MARCLSVRLSHAGILRKRMRSDRQAINANGGLQRSIVSQVKKFLVKFEWDRSQHGRQIHTWRIEIFDHYIAIS